MDRISAELRAAEKQVDEAYKSNPLTKLDLASCLWIFLTAFEHELFLAINRNDVGRFQLEPVIDHYLYMVRWPIYWLRNSCSPGGSIPSNVDSDLFGAARDLRKLASEYVDFYKAFTMASRGIIELKVEENNLISAERIATETQYEAYNRLVKPIGAGFSDAGLMSGFEEIQSKISSTLKVKDQRYSFTITPELVAFTIETFQPLMEQKFILPDSWRFARYSISDFRQAFSVISALANLQYAARGLAVQFGDLSTGIASSIIVMSRAALISKILRYSNLARKVAIAILEDMTLGARGISLTEADPTLQPLIPLNEGRYAIVPQLWINSAAERNFVALINRMPKERAIYLSLVQDKEAVMRERIVEALNRPVWRFKSGRVLSGKLPDIDLAIIDPPNRCCLLLELKWFLDPAEPRELLQKSEERSGKVLLSFPDLKKRYSRRMLHFSTV